MAKKKPGVMLYFDIRPCLKRLTMEQQGELFNAILDYGEHGVEPDFSDAMIGIAWDFIQPRLEKDDEAYKRKSEQASAAANARWGAKQDADGCGRIQTDAEECEDMRGMPTTTTTTTSSSTSSTSTNRENVPTEQERNIAQGEDVSPAGCEEAKPKRSIRGKYGWVKLTDEEYARLVKDLGQKELDCCIEHIDESAQISGNKNKWKDWNLVIRKCSRQKWYLTAEEKLRNRKEEEEDNYYANLC